MGRPRKGGILYFSHDADASDSPKFCALRGRFGWAGEGRFWALNGMIARADGCKLDLARGFIRPAIAEKLGLSLTEFDDFITFLSDPQACDLLHNDAGIVWTDRCLEEMEEVVRYRNDDRERKRTGKPSIPPGIQPDNSIILPESGKKTGFSTEGGKGGIGREGIPENSPLSAPPTPQEKLSTKVDTLISALHDVEPGLLVGLEARAGLEQLLASVGADTIAAVFRFNQKSARPKPLHYFLTDFSAIRAAWEKVRPAQSKPRREEEPPVQRATPEEIAAIKAEAAAKGNPALRAVPPPTDPPDTFEDDPPFPEAR